MSKLIALIPSRSIRQMLANFSGLEVFKTVAKFRKRKNKALSRPRRGVTAKKSTKMRDARAELLFC